MTGTKREIPVINKSHLTKDNSGRGRAVASFFCRDTATPTPRSVRNRNQRNGVRLGGNCRWTRSNGPAGNHAETTENRNRKGASITSYNKTRPRERNSQGSLSDWAPPTPVRRGTLGTNRNRCAGIMASNRDPNDTTVGKNQGTTRGTSN